MTKLVLSLDGGGVRGVLSARILERIEEARSGTCAAFNMYAGTSAGSAGAVGLALGLSPGKIRELYEKVAREVFSHRDMVDRITSLDEIMRADFDPGKLKEVLRAAFGDRTVADLSKSVMVPAMDMTRYKTKFFDQEDKDWCLWEVCMASMAAPTYFPAFAGPDGCMYVDGGLFANNPCDRAVTQAQYEGYLLGEIVLLSVGTGAFPRRAPKGTEMDWGPYQWLVDPGPLLPAVFDAPVMSSTTTCARQLGARFHRIQPRLPRDIGLADIEALDGLVEIADGIDLESTLAWVDQHVSRGENQGKEA